MSGSPAAARNVASQSWWVTMPFDHRARLELARPAHESRHAPAAFPVGVLLGPERRDAGIRPAVVVDAVVGGVHDDGVVGDAQFVELVQHLADALVVGDHHVVVVSLPPLLPLCSSAGCVRKCMAVVLNQRKKGLSALCASSRKCRACDHHLVVDGLHPLLRQRPGVLDLLPALAVGPAVQHASRPEPLPELGVLRVVRILGFFLGVEVVEVAEELVEAVHGWAGTHPCRPGGSCRTGRSRSRAA